MTAREIHIEDVGPISNLGIPLPDGGVVVLRGRNGSGKSYALEAADVLARGKTGARLEPRDGTSGRGLVAGLGATVRVGRQQRRTGGDELEVLALAPDLSPATLVDPKRKDPGAADKDRISVLLRLGQVTATLDDFAPLVGGREELERLVNLDDLDADDPQVIAARVAKALHAVKRTHQGQADTLTAALEAARQEIDESGVGEDEQADEAALQASYEAAVREHAAAEQQAADASAATTRAAQAREQLAEAGDPPSVATAEGAHRHAVHAVESRQDNVQAAREALAKAEADLAEHVAKAEQAAAAVTSAKAQAATLQAAHDAIAAAEGIDAPDEHQLSNLRAGVDLAMQAITRGAEVRRIAALRAKLEVLKADRQAAQKTARRFKDAAQSCDDVLSGLVSRCGVDGLGVRAGRLVVATDRSDATPFHDLSHGEKWRIAMPAFMNAVGRGGLICIPQEGWEAEDPQNRDWIAQQASAAGVVVLTAEAGPQDEIAVTQHKPAMSGAEAD